MNVQNAIERTGIFFLVGRYDRQNNECTLKFSGPWTAFAGGRACCWIEVGITGYLGTVDCHGSSCWTKVANALMDIDKKETA